MQSQTFDVSDIDDAIDFDDMDTAVYLTTCSTRTRTRRFRPHTEVITIVMPVITDAEADTNLKAGKRE